MNIASIIGGNSVWIGLLLVGGVLIWKFLIQPRINDGEPFTYNKENDWQYQLERVGNEIKSSSPS